MRDSKKEKLMHSVSVYPCLSETVCAQTLCMWLPSFDMLSCPDLQMTTASSSSWGSSPMRFLTQNTCFVYVRTRVSDAEVQKSQDLMQQIIILLRMHVATSTLRVSQFPYVEAQKLYLVAASRLTCITPCRPDPCCLCWWCFLYQPVNSMYHHMHTSL